MMNNYQGRYERLMGNASTSMYSNWPIAIGAILISTVAVTFVVVLMLNIFWPSYLVALAVLLVVRIVLIAFRLKYARHYWRRGSW